MFTIEFDEGPFFTVGADRQCNSNCSFRAALNHFVSATVAVTNTVTAAVRCNGWKSANEAKTDLSATLNQPGGARTNIYAHN